MAARKLWKVVYGDLTWRPESKLKVYSIYIHNARQRHRTLIGGGPAFAEVYVDERDGRGFQLYERVNLVEPEQNEES